MVTLVPSFFKVSGWCACSFFTDNKHKKMAESEEEESWDEFFETNRLVPIHPNRCTGQQPQPDISFCLTLKSIEGVVLPKILVSVFWKVCFFPREVLIYRQI